MKKIILGVILSMMALTASGIGFADDAGYVASKGGGKYHLATCSVAKQFKADNKVTFTTPEEAIKAGYTACKVCNPPEKTVAFVVSKGSDKYHKTDCRLAANIKADNKVNFPSQAEAEKAGYKACAICFPADKKQDKMADSKKTK